MKKNQLQEVRTKTLEELKLMLIDLRKDLFQFKLDHKTQKLKNTRSIFNTKDDIARVLTIIREKELLNASS